MTLARPPALTLAALLLQGCASRAETLVVVVPSRHDGHVGAVVVNEADKREVLNTAYAAARTRAGSGEVLRTIVTTDAVGTLFSDASAALPRKAVTYTLYFRLATLQLTPESSLVLQAMLDEVAARQAAEIIISGHTDRLGTDERNDALSLKRAQVVRDLVIRRGTAPGTVSAVGLGEREPVVPTGDNVAEPKNRRVEILVR